MRIPANHSTFWARARVLCSQNPVVLLEVPGRRCVCPSSLEDHNNPHILSTGLWREFKTLEVLSRGRLPPRAAQGCSPEGVADGPRPEWPRSDPRPGRSMIIGVASRESRPVDLILRPSATYRLRKPLFQRRHRTQDTSRTRGDDGRASPSVAAEPIQLGSADRLGVRQRARACRHELDQ